MSTVKTCKEGAVISLHIRRCGHLRVQWTVSPICGLHIERLQMNTGHAIVGKRRGEDSGRPGLASSCSFSATRRTNRPKRPKTMSPAPLGSDQAAFSERNIQAPRDLRRMRSEASAGARGLLRTYSSAESAKLRTSYVKSLYTPDEYWCQHMQYTNANILTGLRYWHIVLGGPVKRTIPLVLRVEHSAAVCLSSHRCFACQISYAEGSLPCT
ncbi:hypothetical protein C8Q80DRAFT_857800 [Daedaleopsis nitida]|nr:hypothetical protein C8Q80DRAFT_857800 [Daedaleopsis nitida]